MRRPLIGHECNGDIVHQGGDGDGIDRLEFEGHTRLDIVKDPGAMDMVGWGCVATHVSPAIGSGCDEPRPAA
jgi:hypothetical protein